jgi:hypothetical protein
MLTLPTIKLVARWWQPHFVNLDLGHNKLSGSIPPSIKDMQNVQYLLLYGNKFTGTIPTEIGELKSVDAIHLSENRFNGTIPSEFGNLELLYDLNLSRNVLCGALPPELGNLDLLSFIVHKNRLLSGDIPESFYNLTNLTTVDLSECNFTGTISPMIGNLKCLLDLRINDNSFKGKIPAFSWLERDAADVGNFQFQHNRFQGKMPRDVCQISLKKPLLPTVPTAPIRVMVLLQVGWSRSNAIAVPSVVMRKVSVVTRKTRCIDGSTATYIWRRLRKRLPVTVTPRSLCCLAHLPATPCLVGIRTTVCTVS